MNWSAATVALVPADVLTVTSTTLDPAGAAAVMLVSPFTVNVAALLPKATADAPVKCVPVMTTDVPW